MTSAEIKIVLCPCCNKSLYRAADSGKGKGVFLVTKDSPRVLEDDAGYFIKCPHCSKRIAMIVDPALPNSGFYVSPEQKQLP